jgi:hypothetical protein
MFTKSLFQRFSKRSIAIEVAVEVVAIEVNVDFRQLSKEIS